MTRALGETLDNASISLRGLGAASWVDKLVNKHWQELIEAAPDGAVPIAETVSRRGKVTLTEYGCGHYGCVLPTVDDNVVMKITSDESEAFFVACALGRAGLDEGLAQYMAIRAFPVGTLHKGRRVFVLWREAARDVGTKPPKPWGYDTQKDDYLRRSVNEVQGLLWAFQSSARVVREAHLAVKKRPDAAELLELASQATDDGWDWAAENFEDLTKFSARYEPVIARKLRGMKQPQRYGYALAVCRQAAEHMENTYLSDLVGGALSFYLEKGLLLADVHENNLGRVDRVDEDGRPNSPLVITDPGHAVALDERWREVIIKEL